MAVDVKEMSRKACSFAEDVKKVMSVDKVILFGSYAKGYATELSDVDICFFLKDYNRKQWVEIIAELSVILYPLSVAVNVIFFRCFL